MRRKLFILILLGILASAAFYFYEQSERQPSNELVLFGNVDVRQVDLGFRVSGQLKELFFEEGDRVQPNQLMAVLDRAPYFDQVEQAKASINAIKASLQNTEQILKRRQELVGDGSVSREDLESARANYDVQRANLAQAEASLGIAKSNLSFTKLYAPQEGLVLTRVREPGSVVNPSEAVYTLTLTSPVWIRAYCSEPHLGQIYPGMLADIYTDTPGGTVYSGKIGFISPVAEFTPKTVETTQLRTDLVYRLRIYVDTPDQGLRQGMPVTVKLALEQKQT